MFRLWLAAVSTIAVLFVVTLSVSLNWAAKTANQNFEIYRRDAIAYERYERLAHEAYRYFESEIERLTLEHFEPLSQETFHHDRLIEALNDLRDTSLSLTDVTPENREELHRIAKLAAFLNDSRYQFHDIAQLRKRGQHALAREQLEHYSNNRVDHDFQPLIDEGIRIHRDRAALAQTAVSMLNERSRWLAILIGVAATLISLTGGVLLSQRFSRSIRALMTGTQHIAKGKLSARIQLVGDDEFNTLATHFNQMAERLESQREALQERQDLLEARVTERTQELLDLNQNLCRMDQDRRAFLADVSHELRTPITIIRGEAEIALRNVETTREDYREALQRIIDLSIQLGDHVHALLAGARAEPGHHNEAIIRPIDLKDLLAEVHLDLKILAEAQDIDVRLILPEQPAWALGDTNRLRQAILILGDNACRYSPRKATIELSLKLADDRAILRLEDQGIGIPAGEIDHIFERCFRGENARDVQPEGLGLGLAMVRSILSQHNGTITVESEVGHGSSFTISLPLLSVTSPNLQRLP